MKKTIIVLLVLLVCAIQTSTAYEYFTIYFSDGTKSEAFYATDVDSICYSKLSLDGIEYPDWQVQEIYICDSVYRYPLAQIDSLSFKDVDENKVAEDIANISAIITPIYSKCCSTVEISQYLPTILNIIGVEEAWTDNQSLFVKVRNWGTMSFSYPPAEEFEDDSFPQLSRMANTRTTQYSSNYKACIINQMYNDQGRVRPKNAASKLSNKFKDMGIECKAENHPLAHFFHNEIFDYDLVFLMTHGNYDGQSHWLFTSEEILVVNDANTIDSAKLDSLAYDLLKKKYPNYSPNMLSLGWLSETRNDIKVKIFYVKISEHFIATPGRDYNGRNAVVFNLACQSLKGNPGLANAFLEKGAKCYLGYTESNRIGAEGGESFFNNLMNGICAYGAKAIIPPKWCTESYGGIKPTLELWAKSKKETLEYNITKPETLPAEIYADGEEIKIKGQIKILNPNGEEAQNNIYGFLYGESPNMDDCKPLEGIQDFDVQTHILTFEYIFRNKELKSGTKYYYCACMNDGYSDCFGEIKSFTTKGGENGDAEAYTVFDGNTLTFYYDNKKNERKGAIYEIAEKYDENDEPKWRSSYPYVVSFDSLFVNYTPTSTARWFKHLSSLGVIENLKYLNTANVTDMSEMFVGCSHLTNLDLSSFNTANVTYLNEMFWGCSSLTNLDLSSFNTANVTYMNDMFRECASLTSLDLSSFNTANVTHMRWMFCDCSFLINLDLSSFNTANVTDMIGMFNNCTSLASLDLSSFNTANVTNMRWMFSGCSSLQTIYARNWDLKKVIDSGFQMFVGCSNLVGGKGTKEGKNLYGYDNNGYPLSYHCYDDASSAHIDGGKDDPGLFTAK